MGKNVKKDNTTLNQKAALRRNLLKEVPEPLVMETHGGQGQLWRRCYSHLGSGIVLEKNPDKAGLLARQRPSWLVYECEAVRALRNGLGRHLSINFLDVDPYGEPWPILMAFFKSDRPFPPILGVAVNDGLRQNLAANGGWKNHSLQELGMVVKYGNAALHRHYLAVCREALEKIAGERGYSLARWGGYYCGHGKQMTHYAALLVRSEE